MSQLISPLDNHVPPRIMVNVRNVLTPKQFEQLCVDNPDLRLELTSTGELILMPPTGSKTGLRNFKLTRQLGDWVEKDGKGVGFGSSTGFTLPNGAKLSPDAAWVRRERWDALSEQEQEGFAPLCPDFVVELRSRTDGLPPLQDKMQEYITNGAQLAWLIDPLKRQVYIYRPGHDVEVLEDSDKVSGDPVLADFVLDLRELW
jgi:Uma2 family endonuclease